MPSNVGRKPKPPGTTVKDGERVVVDFNPMEFEIFQRARGAKGKAPYIKELIIQADSISNFQFQTLPYLTSAPAGSWREALADAGQFTLSADVKDELQAANTDKIVRVRGDSMRGAGILDGALCIVQTLNEKQAARRGQIALVQIMLNNGELYESTIKRIGGVDSRGAYQLLDGDDKEFPLPENTEKVVAIGVVRGVIQAV